MKEVYVENRGQWRDWLKKHHDKEPKGIWLIFDKKRDAGRSFLQYEEAVEEALCYGWIDSIIRRIDDARYCRKFTPRRDDSSWSRLNRERVERVIRAGRMTAFGLAKIEAAKRLGRWELDRRPVLSAEIPKELSRAFAGNRKAREYFGQLAPSHQKRFVGWLVTAKRIETRARRLKECLALLASGKTLGMK